MRYRDRAALFGNNLGYSFVVLALLISTVVAFTVRQFESRNHDALLSLFKDSISNLGTKLSDVDSCLRKEYISVLYPTPKHQIVISPSIRSDPGWKVPQV